MGRFSCFLILLLGNAVRLRNSVDAVPFFDPNVSKYKLPTAFYPENDRDAIPVRESLRTREVPNIDLADFKLPKEFYPENDRDAVRIPVRPSPKNLTQSKDVPFEIPPGNQVDDTYTEKPEKKFRFARIFRKNEHPKQGKSKKSDKVNNGKQPKKQQGQKQKQSDSRTTSTGNERDCLGKEAFLEKLQKTLRDIMNSLKGLLDNGK